MKIKRAGSQPSAKGPGDWFTGTVRVDALFEAPDPARARGASVTFEPGARTAWHTHPLGQTLIVTSGVGRVQKLGGPVEEIRPGDVVWFEPNEKHWHGASPTVAMTHIAIQFPSARLPLGFGHRDLDRTTIPFNWSKIQTRLNGPVIVSESRSVAFLSISRSTLDVVTSRRKHGLRQLFGRPICRRYRVGQINLPKRAQSTCRTHWERCRAYA